MSDGLCQPEEGTFKSHYFTIIILANDCGVVSPPVIGLSAV